TSEREMVAKEKGESRAANLSTDAIYKIEVPANRYDLLCAEGLCRALQIFYERATIPIFKKTNPSSKLQIKVSPEVAEVRPYVVGAVLRNIKFDQDRYNSFIDLQDKIHSSIGRKRTLVSIGTHDLDTLKPPFLYKAEKPEQINFVPLSKTQSYSAAQLMDLYFGDSHLKPFLSIVRGKPLFPVIRDSANTVASFPPIINSEHSKITLATKNVFVEITATDLHKASIALDTVVTMFSEYCGEQFSVEPVEVLQADGTKQDYPKLSYREEIVSVDYINTLLGTQLTAVEMVKLMHKMGLHTKMTEDSLLTVTVPPTRHDILHACDIAEDVGIAFGYDNIEEALPHTFCISGSTE
ncbi:hypothetical protein Ciccas_013023, partial [Cichlidogyrus casuarinus]